MDNIFWGNDDGSSENDSYITDDSVSYTIVIDDFHNEYIALLIESQTYHVNPTNKPAYNPKFVSTKRNRGLDITTVIGDLADMVLLVDGKMRLDLEDNFALFLGYTNDTNKSYLDYFQMVETFEALMQYLFILLNRGIDLETFQTYKSIFNANFSYNSYFVGKDKKTIRVKPKDIYDNKIIDMDMKTHHFVCDNFRGVVFSILYFYLIKGFKIVSCPHCGKYFATRTLKQKYCTRKSPYNGYEHLNCEQAVRNIKQECTRHKKKIYNYFVTHSEDMYGGDEMRDFLNECDLMSRTIQKYPSMDNLKKYDDYLVSQLKKLKAGKTNG